MTRHFYKVFPICIVSICSVFVLAGCISLSTLQTAETVDPGNVQLGLGAAYASGFMLEAGARVGVLKNLDVGAKYSFPSLVWLDGKIQLTQQPDLFAFDLGWSSFSTDWGLLHSEAIKTTTSCWYPAIYYTRGRFYTGVRGTIMKLNGTVSVFDADISVHGTKYVFTNLVLGYSIGDKVRVLPEINIYVPSYSGKTALVPAVGLQLWL